MDLAENTQPARSMEIRSQAKQLCLERMSTSNRDTAKRREHVIAGQCHAGSEHAKQGTNQESVKASSEGPTRVRGKGRRTTTVMEGPKKIRVVTGGRENSGEMMTSRIVENIEGQEIMEIDQGEEDTTAKEKGKNVRMWKRKAREEYGDGWGLAMYGGRVVHRNGRQPSRKLRAWGQQRKRRVAGD